MQSTRIAADMQADGTLPFPVPERRALCRESVWQRDQGCGKAPLNGTKMLCRAGCAPVLARLARWLVDILIPGDSECCAPQKQASLPAVADTSETHASRCGYPPLTTTRNAVISKVRVSGSFRARHDDISDVDNSLRKRVETLCIWMVSASAFRRPSRPVWGAGGRRMLPSRRALYRSSLLVERA